MLTPKIDAERVIFWGNKYNIDKVTLLSDCQGERAGGCSLRK